METFGLVLLALIFALSGINHVKNHASVAGYASTVFGNCPYAIQLGYLGGWPTGIVLLAVAVGLVLQYVAALTVAIIFLAITQYLFHRDLKDAGNLKHLALIGALLALLANVS